MHTFWYVNMPNVIAGYGKISYSIAVFWAFLNIIFRFSCLPAFLWQMKSLVNTLNTILNELYLWLTHWG